MSIKKVENIQGLRGIAVLLVVFSHMLPIEKKYAEFEYVLPELFLIGVSGVDLFFLISGFVMVAVTRSSFQSKIEIQKFLYHRVTRIYPLYWFYSLLVLGVYLVQPSFINSSQNNQVNILASFLLIPQSLLPLVNVGWTLIHEMYFYLVFTILLLLPRSRLFIGLICWAGVVVVGNICFSGTDNPFVKVYFSPLTIEFIVGALIAILYYGKEIRGNARAYAFIAFITWIAGYYLFQMMSGDITPTGWARVLVFGVPASLVLYSALLSERNSGIIMPAWICKIGDASYSIYLLHVIVLSVVGRLWVLFAEKGLLDNMLMLSIMFFSVLYAGFFSFNFIEKKLLRKTKWLETKIFLKK